MPNEVVGGNQRQILDRGLGNQDPIEGILVNRRQGRNRSDVLRPQDEGAAASCSGASSHHARGSPTSKLPFILLSTTSQQETAPSILGPPRTAMRIVSGRRSGSARAISTYRADTGSKVAFEKSIQVNRIVPARQEFDAVLHAAQPDRPSFGRRGAELGDGLAVAGDDDLSPLSTARINSGRRFLA